MTMLDEKFKIMGTKTKETRYAKIRWFSGSGAGGQHRNKHANCCEITDPLTGISAVGQGAKSRETNKHEAIQNLKRKLVAHYHRDKERNSTNTIIRTVKPDSDLVIDHRTCEKTQASKLLKGEIIITNEKSERKTGRM